jgi:hypothetical protein
VERGDKPRACLPKKNYFHQYAIADDVQSPFTLPNEALEGWLARPTNRAGRFVDYWFRRAIEQKLLAKTKGAEPEKEPPPQIAEPTASHLWRGQAQTIWDGTWQAQLDGVSSCYPIGRSGLRAVFSGICRARCNIVASKEGKNGRIRPEHELLERKQKTSAEVLSEQPRRDTYGPEHGSGDPQTNWDDRPLRESKVWQSHKSAKPKK